MKTGRRKRGESFWPSLVMKKWLNIKPKGDEFSEDERDTESEFEDEDSSVEREPLSSHGNKKTIFHSRTTGIPLEHFLRRHRRGNSETLRVQYIDTKEIKISVSSWNVAGRVPPDDLDIEEWLDVKEPADIYVIGFQEVVPLNAGNVLGAEDSSPVSKWEALIRKTLNQAPQDKPKCQSYSAPPSPILKTPDGSENNADEFVASETDMVCDEDINLLPLALETPKVSEFTTLGNKAKLKSVYSRLGRIGFNWPEQSLDSVTQDLSSGGKLKRVYSSSGRLGLSWPEHSLHCETENLSGRPLRRVYSMSGRLGLNWPEQPLDSETLDLVSTVGSMKATNCEEDLKESLKTFSVSGSEGTSALSKRIRTNYVRIVSKQMVGIFVTVWVRRVFRRHIHNLKVSPVGVGLMGYIGNKGSVSVSMSIFQTSLCFVCSHLTSGEKDGDEQRRNSDVLEILRRTHFPSIPGVEMPETILEHDGIIWFGDLNYRLNMSDGEARNLVAKEEWEDLISRDQLRKELRQGRVFDGWREGSIDFAPTYKYEFNSDKYFGENAKAGEKRRTPAWCDRILWLGKSIKQLSYRRAELVLSDHRPVNSVFVVEVEIFSHRKLQKALTYTDAELGVEELMS